jgi:serine/threonine protein kinase
LSAKPPRLKPKTAIGRYRIIEFVGGDAGRSLYSASKDDTAEVYWLFESYSQIEVANLGPATPDSFQFGGKNYFAFPIPGTSLSMLAAWIPSIDYAFIVPRWISVAQQVGFLHAKGRAYQQSIPFDLNNIIFGENGQLVPLSFPSATPVSMPFPAPETASGAITPASDVYSLGAGLMEVLGARAPGTAASPAWRPNQLAGHSDLARVLKKATQPDPSKRYQDANLLLAALSGVTPKSKPQPTPKVKRKNIQLLSLVPFILLLLILLAGVLVYVQGYTPASFAFLQKPTATPDTLAALPKGSLAFDVLDIRFTPDKVGHVDLRLTKGGKPVPTSSPINFDLEADGHTVESLGVTNGASDSGSAGDTGLYQLSYDSSALSSTRGTYRLTAKVIGGSLSRTIYFDYSASSQADSGLIPTDKGGLGQFSVTGVQVDAGRYPDLTLYFGLSSGRGAVGRLSGLVFVELEQDNEPVGEFLMNPVDPAQDPVTAALAVDVSGSMKGEPLQKAQEAASEFVGELAPKDQACVYSFSTFITRLMKCSTDKGNAKNAISAMEASGNTSLYDALLVVAGDLAKIPGRKDIIVLSDGADTASQATKNETLTQLKQVAIPVYTIGLTSPQFRGDLLREFSSQSGGAFLEAPSPADLRGLYSSINSQLKNEYRLDFKSLFPDRSGGAITIRLIQGSETIENTLSFSAPK